MKRLFMALLLTVALPLTPHSAAHAYTITDDYWGGTPSSASYANRDVIGLAEYYDSRKMEVTFSGSTLNVAVFSTFIGQLQSAKIWNDKTKLGDLFIGTKGWNPTGTGADHFAGDTVNTTGTDWNFAAVLDYHGPNYKGDTTSGGSVSLYTVEDGTKILSSAPTGFIYRKDQLVQFSPDTLATPLATGSWSLTDIGGTAYDKLLFSLDVGELLGTTSSDTWAFHWAMTCGNDVIEGAAPIPTPEPSTLLLCGAGLLGVVYMKRKNLPRKSG